MISGSTVLKRTRLSIDRFAGIVEPALVVLAAPLLLFPLGRLPWVGIGLLLLAWISRGATTGQWLVRTPLDRPIAIIFIMTMVSLYPAVDRSLSLPRFFGIIFCIAVFYATVANVTSKRRLSVMIMVLVASIVVVSSIGLVGTDWIVGKYDFLQRLYGSIPRLISNVRTSTGTVTGIHPNALGCALAFLLPLPIALVIRPQLPRYQKLALAAVIFSGSSLLVLSASRSSILGLGIAILILVAWRWHRVGLLLIAAAFVSVALAFILSPQATTDVFLRADAMSSASVTGSLPGRLAIWERARYMIEDFPFTGVGLNNFPLVLNNLYPITWIGSGTFVPHAHNIYLQTAVDLGLGGLMGFIGLWARVAFAGWQTYQQLRRVPSLFGALDATVVGLLLGMLAYLVFGLTDGISLGSEPLVLLWLMMGLVVAIQKTVADRQPAVTDDSHRANSGPSALSKTRWFAVNVKRLKLAFNCLLRVVLETYWMIAFFLVGVAILVVSVRVSGWTP